MIEWRTYWWGTSLLANDKQSAKELGKFTRNLALQPTQSYEQGQIVAKWRGNKIRRIDFLR